ncbi:MAG: glycosyltransferase, partial [Xenococcaceae cyanobacterium MO_234.B1]|nr:glycosyltransferase [Xenococcaceae cyanobacterium MO_234.B1]
PYIMRPLGTLDPADLQKKKQLKQIYGLLLEKPNLAGASAIHFTSQEEAKVSERYGTNTPDLVIPLGVNLPKSLPPLGKMGQELNINQATPIILFMSRIDPKKGLDLLLPALETLQQEGIKFHFVLAGANPQDPDYENSISQQIKQSPLNTITTITGFVQGETKLGLLQDADIFVLPSYYENFGIAVAEAMATGTPVVISDRVHIWQEIQSAAAGWVSSCDFSQLTQTLRQVLQNPSDWQEKGINARNLVQNNYSWNAIAEQMVTAYQAILN